MYSSTGSVKYSLTPGVIRRKNGMKFYRKTPPLHRKFQDADYSRCENNNYCASDVIRTKSKRIQNSVSCYDLRSLVRDSLDNCFGV